MLDNPLKFCNLACKNKYYNQRLKEKKERRLNIIRKLSRNYEILESLLEEEQSFYYIEDSSNSVLMSDT